MVVTFRTRMPVAETMRFEHVYEDVLQLDVEAKASILDAGYGAWLFVDGTLAGETYGISPALLDEDVDDVPEREIRLGSTVTRRPFFPSFAVAGWLEGPGCVFDRAGTGGRLYDDRRTRDESGDGGGPLVLRSILRRRSPPLVRHGARRAFYRLALA
jgi:hypothetical protein